MATFTYLGKTNDIISSTEQKLSIFENCDCVANNFTIILECIERNSINTGRNINGMSHKMYKCSEVTVPWTCYTQKR